jgi:cellobiose phosphorylase
MSLNEEELEQKLAEEREKVRLNAIKMLKFIGYKGDVSKLTQEQIDARIELLMEQKKNAEIEATKNGEISKPAFFTGIDEEKENIDKVKNASPSELDFAEYMEGYDALTARISVLRPNSQVGHAIQFAPYEQCRIIRLPASIRLNEHQTVMRRVVL